MIVANKKDAAAKLRQVRSIPICFAVSDGSPSNSYDSGKNHADELLVIDKLYVFFEEGNAHILKASSSRCPAISAFAEKGWRSA